MFEYALLIDNEFKEIREYETKPMNIPHKKVTWHDVIRETGQTEFTGLENGNWVIRTALPTFEELKTQKLNDLANKRWQKEIGGIIFNGMSLATDIESQTKYVGAVVGAQLDPNTVVNWKMADGSFVELDAAGITAVAMAVRSHIQTCFDIESAYRELIELAVDKDDLNLIDISVGWPS
jgi:hypothetical protein